MADNRKIKAYYLKKLAEYRKDGLPDDKAARYAEQDTIAKYGAAEWRKVR